MPRPKSRTPGFHLGARCSILVLGLAWPACDGSTGQQVPDVIVRDSVGIQIVENHAPVWGVGELWTVEPEPTFVVGGYSATSDTTDDTSHLVWGIKVAIPLPGGGVAMLSPHGDRKVLVFGSSGEPSAYFGRTGRGPGEFFHPVHLQVLSGDTIAVWDQGFAVSHFDLSGTLIGHRRIDRGAVVAAIRQDNQVPGESVYLPLPDGSFLVEVFPSDWQLPNEGEVYRRPTGYVRIDSSYSAHSFGWWDGLEMIQLDYPFLPFEVQSMVAAGGSPLSVYVTNGDRYEIHQFSVDGVLKRIVRRMEEPIPITRTEIGEWRAANEVVNSEMDWSTWEMAIEGLPTRFHPSIVGLQVDPKGYLWVMDRWERNRSEWSIFNPEGRWLGTLEFAASGLGVGDSLVIGQHVDFDTGIQTLKGYRIRRQTDPS